ncbi:MAG: DUF5785 family protein [Halobacteria archaeon]
MVINEPEDGRSYGMAKVSQWVDEEDLPLTKQDLDEYADRRIRMSNEKEVTFRDVLKEVDDEGPYEDLPEMWKALSPGFRELEPEIKRRYGSE